MLGKALVGSTTHAGQPSIVNLCRLKPFQLSIVSPGQATVETELAKAVNEQDSDHKPPTRRRKNLHIWALSRSWTKAGQV
jgi:hypothetical protein